MKYDDVDPDLLTLLEELNERRAAPDRVPLIALFGASNEHRPNRRQRRRRNRS